MNEAQVWTMVVGTVTAFFALAGLITTWFTRLIRSEFSTVDAKFETVNARFDAVDARFDAVDVKFEAVNDKLAHLDRDVQALTTRVFRQPE